MENKDFKLQLSTTQQEKFDKWRDELVEKYKGRRMSDSTGCFCEFSIVPSSMGYTVKVKALFSKDELDLTEYDDYD